jgi:transposase
MQAMAKPDLDAMNADELRQVAASLFRVIEAKDTELKHKNNEIHWKDLKISQLSHEMAILKRWRFGRAAEEFHGLQRNLLEESIDEDLGAIEIELDTVRDNPKPKKIPVRAHLPVDLPRVTIQHEPDSTVCGCGCQMKRIGEDVAEKLDYVPGTFQVEHHVRGKWVCETCETIVQKPVAPHVIDKGIPTAGLLAQVLVAKYSDHLPLYRQEEIYGRTGVPIPRSTMAEWVGACGVKLQPLGEELRNLLLKRSVLHADETPMPTLRPGLKKTHRSYLWAYGTTPYDPDPIVVYDFAAGRSGEHARAFLGDWRGKLVCDDFSGYKALFERGAVVEIGCLAHCPEPRFMRGASCVTAEIVRELRSMNPDNNSGPIRWNQGKPADRAWATRDVRGWAKGRSVPRNARVHRASSASWCSRSGWWSRCWHGRGNHGSRLYRLQLATRPPRSCVAACAA